MNDKTLTKLDFDEFKKEWLQLHSYINNYNEEKKEKELQTSFKRYALFKTMDGLILMFDIKPSISSTMYYDDEEKGPEKVVDSFIDYNMQLNFKYKMDDWINAIDQMEKQGHCSGLYNLKPYFINNYMSNKKFVAPKFYSYGQSDYNLDGSGDKLYIRELSSDEIKKYLEICELLEEDYKNRLIKYFKKYNKNIYTQGYWRDR